LEECGAEGYGAYWLIIEDIAGPMESGRMEPAATHSDVTWARLIRVHPLRWKSLKKKLGSKLLVITESADGRVRIAAPNILKYKDEYSKKSGHRPVLSRGRADADTEAEGEQRSACGAAPENPAPSPPDVFARMLKRHPYPSNALDAAHQFGRVVKTASDIESSETNHTAWCEYWEKKTAEEGRAPWIPTLSQFFMDGYYAKLPPVRDGPKAAPKSMQVIKSEEAEQELARLVAKKRERQNARVS